MASDDEIRMEEKDFSDGDSFRSSKPDMHMGLYQQDPDFLHQAGGYPQRKKELSFSPETSRDWKMSSFSPGMDDAGRFRIENNQLKLQVKQLQVDLQTEQDTVSNLRKRLNTVERDRLESASRANTEMSELESQIARLRSQLEKGEASKANMEFELTRARRDISQHKQSAAEQCGSLEELNNELKKKLSDYGNEIHRLEEELQRTKEGLEEKERQMQREKEIRDLETSKGKTENEILQTERDKLDTLVQQHESNIADLNEKLQEFDMDRKHQADNLRRTVTELDYCKEREEKGKKDLELALQRLRAVEESIESERAAHLETKFNSEIVQLRVRDIEGALEVEKSANNEANKAIDRLTKQIRELEHTTEDERKNAKQLQDKLSKLEKEHSSVKKVLTSEVETKKTTIGNLSKELEIHQKNFIELKEELSKAKKRQIYLEETYGGSMRELELLLQNFQITEEKPKKSAGKGKKEQVNKTPTPSVVLESLRLTLSDYRKRLDNTSEELGKMKKLSVGLTKEIDQCKEMIWAKDKALEDAQKSYTRTAKELNRVRSEYGELEGLLTRLKVDMQSTASNQSKDRNRIQELSEEIMKLVKKHRADEDEKLAFLHGLYQRLLAGCVVPAKEKPFNQFAWADLTSLVFEQVLALINSIQNYEEKIQSMVKGDDREAKISQLEEALKSKEEGLEDAHHSHEDQLTKLSVLTKEREMSWQKQKEEIENHYQQLLDEVQNRAKKSQSMADQAWEKIRMTGTVQQGLEVECAELQNKLSEAQKQNSALLASFSLLCGAFYPLCSRANYLSLQRRIMEDQLNNWDVCKERVELLVSTLTTEMSKRGEKPVQKTKRNPLLVFRMGAVAVLAANRLRRFGKCTARTFVTYDSTTGQNNMLVCTGGTRSRVMGNEAPEREDQLITPQVPGEKELLQWLTSSELLHTLISSTGELLDTVNQVKSKDKVGPVENRAVVNAARVSFTRLFDRLGRYYEGITMRPEVGFRERNSLVKMLGRGLNKILKGKISTGEDQKYAPASPQDLMISLQNHILDFTQRLHTVEVERRSLLKEVSRLQEENEKLGPEKEEITSEHSDMAITEQGNKYVPMEKFESVCSELNNALRREEQAQQLLHEQSKQLEELSMRMDMFSSEGIEKEQTLTEAIQGLAETKLELRRKEQAVRQVNKQLVQSEAERNSLRSNLQDAEKALRTVAKDKEILTSYIQSVESALDKVKREVAISHGTGKEIHVSLSKVLLNADLIPTDVGKAGPELIACQNLVGCFVETQHQLLGKVKAMEEEMETNKEHVNLLKQELSDAIRRDQYEAPTHDGYQRSRMIRSDDVSEQDVTQRDFLPLREDSEISFNVSRHQTPKSRISPKKSDRVMQYATPNKASRVYKKNKGGQR